MSMTILLIKILHNKNYITKIPILLAQLLHATVNQPLLSDEPFLRGTAHKNGQPLICTFVFLHWWAHPRGDTCFGDDSVHVINDT